MSSLSSSRYHDSLGNLNSYINVYDGDKVTAEALVLDTVFDMTGIWLYILTNLFEAERDGKIYRMELNGALNEGIPTKKFVDQVKCIFLHMLKRSEKTLPPIDIIDSVIEPKLVICTAESNSDYGLKFNSYYNITNQAPLNRALKIYENLFGEIKLADNPLVDTISEDFMKRTGFVDFDENIQFNDSFTESVHSFSC